MLIILGIMGVIFVISMVMACVYCRKHRMIRLELDEDRGIVNRQPSSANLHSDILSARLQSINDAKYNRYPSESENDFSLDREEQ